jgi:ATP-binding cassette subfamily B protein
MTVAENVLTEEVTDENKEIAVNALKMSGAYKKIGRLPDKEDSLLTKEFDKEGIQLSGGETQKVTIARLFARDFSIAVLDEPSSALDPVAESKMYDALMEGTKGKTVIYISHRLSSATHSDKILVFNKGNLSEQGTHEELIAKNGEYAEMFTLQASGYTQDEEVSDIEE